MALGSFSCWKSQVESEHKRISEQRKRIFNPYSLAGVFGLRFWNIRVGNHARHCSWYCEAREQQCEPTQNIYDAEPVRFEELEHDTLLLAIVAVTVYHVCSSNLDPKTNHDKKRTTAKRSNTMTNSILVNTDCNTKRTPLDNTRTFQG